MTNSNNCTYCRDGIPRTEYGVHVVSEFEVEKCVMRLEELVRRKTVTTETKLHRHACPICGTRHSASLINLTIQCVGCGKIVPAGRGGKRFCTGNCRKKIWQREQRAK